MSFLHPLILVAGLGISLPIVAHLFSRYKVQRTDWAAMQFLNRRVRVRSRQLRLQDILLMCIRCLAVLLLVLALAKPFMNDADGMLQSIGEPRVGVVIAIDASLSMDHREGTVSRFEQAIDKVGTIADGLRPGDRVCLVLLDAEHRIVARNMAFDAERFDNLLQKLKTTRESLNLASAPQILMSLAEEMDVAQKEIYILSDMQAVDWEKPPAWLQDAFDNLENVAATTIIPIRGGVSNLAITNLELVSGVMRKNTVARYRATVQNYGTDWVSNIRVKGLVESVTVDTKTIPMIAPGASETVSLFVHFHDTGPVRISAELDPDPLESDNVRRTVAYIRESVSVLVVSGSPLGSGALIETALKARGGGSGEENMAVQTVSWIDLPTQDLSHFDVLILDNVPDITPEQARALEGYVRTGHGLVWFAGDNVDAAVWNKRVSLDGVPLLPAVIEQVAQTSDALGVGKPLNPSMPDHFVCRPLRSLPEDLLSETRFRQALQVKPVAISSTVLSLTGTADPILIEHSIGRGQVFMFTTSADVQWNNLVVTPVFPMVLQQIVTYLTAREFEKPRLVGDSLALSYPDQPDASEAVFDTPGGETITVPVRNLRNEYVALAEHALEDGFYIARVSLQDTGVLIAVNIDTRESDVTALSRADTSASFAQSPITIAETDVDLLAGISHARVGRSFAMLFLLAAFGLLVIESLLAKHMQSWRGGAQIAGSRGL